MNVGLFILADDNSQIDDQQLHKVYLWFGTKLKKYKATDILNVFNFSSQAQLTVVKMSYF